MKLNFISSNVIFVSLLALFTCGALGASKPKPSSSAIYIADIKIVNDSIVLGEPYKITTWKGYNDQPAFMPDGKSLLYTSVGKTNRSEVYRYDIAKKTTVKLTKSPERECCPAVVPGGTFYSVLRLGKDSTRQLWRIPLFKGGRTYVVVPDVKSISSLTWLDGIFGAAVVNDSGGGNTLRTINSSDNTTDSIASNVNNCIQKVPQKGGLCYIPKTNNAITAVMVYDFKERKSFSVIKTVAGSVDFAWSRWDDIVMGQGAKLFMARPPEQTRWKEIADFSKFGVWVIRRIAIDPQTDKIAFVAEEK
jgi:hypothetical protein